MQIGIRDRFRRPDGLLRTPEKPLLPRRRIVSDTVLNQNVHPVYSLSNFSLPMIPKVLKPFSESPSSRERLNEHLPRVFYFSSFIFILISTTVLIVFVFLFNRNINYCFFYFDLTFILLYIDS